MTPLERAAKSLYDRWLKQPDVAREAAANGPHPTWDSVSEAAKAKWLGGARAVLQAIREPSESILEAMRQSIPVDGWEWEYRDEEAPDHWRAMIDAALGEG